MKEHPMLFSGPMVRAILEGRKTHTRRVMKLKISPFEHDGETWFIAKGHHYRTGSFYTDEKDGSSIYPFSMDDLLNLCPYGQPGDRLWVRETFRAWCCDKNTTDMGRFLIRYAADHGIAKAATFLDPDYEGVWHEPYRWFPSIHMPRWASRITLEITGVRVERLQDISTYDAISEGVNCACEPSRPCESCGSCEGDEWDNPIRTQCNPRSSFATLWQSLNAKRPGRTWDDNPWLWVVEFKRVEE